MGARDEEETQRDACVGRRAGNLDHQSEAYANGAPRRLHPRRTLPYLSLPIHLSLPIRLTLPLYILPIYVLLPIPHCQTPPSTSSCIPSPAGCIILELEMALNLDQDTLVVLLIWGV